MKKGKLFVLMKWLCWEESINWLAISKGNRQRKGLKFSSLIKLIYISFSGEIDQVGALAVSRTWGTEFLARMILKNDDLKFPEKKWGSDFNSLTLDVRNQKLDLHIVQKLHKVGLLELKRLH